MRTLRERIVHTVLFECLAIAVVTPSAAWLTGATLASAGLLGVLISIGAMASNAIWTMLFDRFVPTRRRGFWLRASHAAGLEVIIAAFTIPLIIVLTGAPLWTAVILDVGGIVFFVAFSMIYNVIFDAAMIRLAPRAS